MGEAPFQTNTHLSLKKRIKRETQYRITASNHLFFKIPYGAFGKNEKARSLHRLRASKDRKSVV